MVNVPLNTKEQLDSDHSFKEEPIPEQAAMANANVRIEVSKVYFMMEKNADVHSGMKFSSVAKRRLLK